MIDRRRRYVSAEEEEEEEEEELAGHEISSGGSTRLQSNPPSLPTAMRDRTIPITFFLLTRKSFALTTTYFPTPPQEKVGEGSFGEVFRGTWLGTTVAVKTMHSEESSILKMDKFLTEIALTSTLHHPNIVLFYGACVEVPNICLVMEFLNINLYDLLHTGHRSQIQFYQLHRFGCDVARGMRYLHRRVKVIQRDLKSRNIMVDNNFNAKLCDFGLSRYMKTDKTMTFCGTPYWTAPEM